MSGSPVATPVLPVAGLVAAVMVGTTAPNALWPELQRRLDITTTTVTLVFAAYALAVIVALCAFGATSDRVGRRPVLAAALVVSAASSALTLADGLTALIAGRVLSGTSVGLISGAATAYLTELRPGAGPARGAIVATAATMSGLAAGPLLAAVVGDIGPDAVRTPFLAHLATLAVAALALRGPETVARAARRRGVARPALPAEGRRLFTGAALAGFTGNAQLGLYAALAPTFLASLGSDSMLVGGAVGALLFATAGVAQVATTGRSSVARLRAGMALVAVAATALVVALEVGSLPALVVATAIGGTAGGLGFGGGLATASDLARPEQRSAVTSTWFVATYLGLAGPVIGAGWLVDSTSATTAAVLFGLAITAAGAVAALATRARPSAG